MGELQEFKCTAYGIRTRATAVKGRRPRPLDERGRSLSQTIKKSI